MAIRVYMLCICYISIKFHRYTIATTNRMNRCGILVIYDEGDSRSLNRVRWIEAEAEREFLVLFQC